MNALNNHKMSGHLHWVIYLPAMKFLHGANVVSMTCCSHWNNCLPSLRLQRGHPSMRRHTFQG